MPASVESYSLGQQVEITNIGSELKKLWLRGEGAMTRASLVNLALYSEAPDALDKNTQIIAKIADNHACRAIVISAEPNSRESRAEAWINAHCHLTRSGKEQICSEQLSFRLQGPCTSLLASIVFSHLDSDLPFYLWWQGELPESMDPQLWAWVDRLIYDSSDWKNFGVQMRRVEIAQEEAKQRIVFCDLNWTRLDKIRVAIAQFFDHPASHHHFAEMKSVTVDYAPGLKSTAILLIGWLAAQLSWKVNEPARNGSCRFLDANNCKIDVALHESPGSPIGKVVLASREIEFVVASAKCGDLLEVSRSGQHERPLPQMMPAQSNDPVSLLSQELMRGGAHRVYLRAVNCVRELL